MKNRGFSHPVIALLAAVLLMVGARSAVAEEKALSVLVLNSYHQGFAWTDGILEGIREAFGKKGMAADLSVEFMDTKRTFSVRTMSAFFDHFREKYFQKTFDVIICSDDDATAFLMRRGRELFPGVPVVFCGLNNPGLMNFDGAPPFAGVLEQVDIPGTVELIIRHFPNTKNLALVSDLSPSGMSVISQARKDLIPYLDRIAVTDLFGLSGADLQDEVSKLPPDTAILLLVYFQDARGEFYAPERTARLIKKACPFPVFGLWSMMIEGGCLGGSVLIPREHGARAGGLAVRILEGELPGDMPPETDRHPIPLFNYDEMKRFGLGRFTIPGGAKIVGEPETFFYRHRPFILINGLLGSAVLIYLASLLINERLARSAEKELRLRVVQWEGLFQNAPEAYALYNHSNEIITVNRGFTELFGYPAEEVAGKELDSVVADYPGINAEAKEISAKRFSGETFFAEGLRVRKDGSLFYAEIQGSAYPALDDHVLGVAIYRDASRKKEEETELIMSLERESVISSISARLLEKGARGVPGAMGEMAAFLGVNRGALVEMDGDDVPTGEIILTDGEIREGTSPLEFAALPISVLRGFAGRLWEKGPVEMGSSGRPVERHEALILEAAGLQGDHVHAQPVYSGTEGNAFLLLQKGPEPISYADSALITMFCALSGSVLQRDIRMQMIKETNRLLEGASRDIVEILARALSMKDPFTAGHQINVADLAKAMAEKGGYDESFTERVYYSGLVHDLGKIAIPSSILSKPGRLTEVEFEIIKGHVRLGWEILSSVELPWPLAEIILQHHERLDGSGYPGLLEGSSIIKEAHFLAVADVVEAMISHRPYRAGLGIKEALSEIKRFRGIRFDPEAVDLCIAVIEEGFVMSDPSYLPYP